MSDPIHPLRAQAVEPSQARPAPTDAKDLPKIAEYMELEKCSPAEICRVATMLLYRLAARTAYETAASGVPMIPVAARLQFLPNRLYLLAEGLVPWDGHLDERGDFVPVEKKPARVNFREFL